MNELRRIYQLALIKDVVLACWCYPQRCHTQTIKAFLEQYLKQDERYTQHRNKSKHRQPKPQFGLDAGEQKRLEWLKKKGCDKKNVKDVRGNLSRNGITSLEPVI